MSEQTPRVNATYLASFVGSNIRIAGKVVQVHGNSATIDSQGHVTIHLGPTTQIAVPEHIVEVIGTVKGDLSIKELASSDFGTDADMETFESVVQVTHKYPEIFYDPK